MRSLAGALCLAMSVTILASPAWTQMPPSACGPGGCGPYGCNPYGFVPGAYSASGYSPPVCAPSGSAPAYPPYPRYYGYGVSSSNYYQPPPPHILGGPAYGYSAPFPWGACCPPKTYVAPAYPSYYYYPYSGQYHSYFPTQSYAQYAPAGGATGTAFATERTSTKPVAAAASPPPAKPANPPKAKTSSASNKLPASLPDTLSSKKTPPPSADAVDPAAKKPFLQRLLFWQKN